MPPQLTWCQYYPQKCTEGEQVFSNKNLQHQIDVLQSTASRMGYVAERRNSDVRQRIRALENQLSFYRSGETDTANRLATFEGETKEVAFSLANDIEHIAGNVAQLAEDVKLLTAVLAMAIDVSAQGFRALEEATGIHPTIDMNMLVSPEPPVTRQTWDPENDAEFDKLMAEILGGGFGGDQETVTQGTTGTGEGSTDDTGRDESQTEAAAPGGARSDSGSDESPFGGGSSVVDFSAFQPCGGYVSEFESQVADALAYAGSDVPEERKVKPKPEVGESLSDFYDRIGATPAERYGYERRD